MRLLSQKLDEVVGRQERALGLISALHQGGIPQQQIGAQQGMFNMIFHPSQFYQFTINYLNVTSLGMSKYSVVMIVSYLVPLACFGKYNFYFSVVRSLNYWSIAYPRRNYNFFSVTSYLGTLLYSMY